MTIPASAPSKINPLREKKEKSIPPATRTADQQMAGTGSSDARNTASTAPVVAILIPSIQNPRLSGEA